MDPPAMEHQVFWRAGLGAVNNKVGEEQKQDSCYAFLCVCPMVLCFEVGR